MVISLLCLQRRGQGNVIKLREQLKLFLLCALFSSVCKIKFSKVMARIDAENEEKYFFQKYMSKV